MASRTLGKGTDEYVFTCSRAYISCEFVFVAAAALELGALFGALSSGILADKYSRRHSIFLASGEPGVNLGFFLLNEPRKLYFALVLDCNPVLAISMI